MAKQFEDLEVWKLARALTTDVYRLAAAGDFARDYGLKGQICRAAVSIMSNISEGFERKSDKSFQQFLAIAKGSAGEVRSQLYVALDLGYITEELFQKTSDNLLCVCRMLTSMIQYLSSVNSRPKTKDLGPRT